MMKMRAKAISIDGIGCDLGELLGVQKAQISKLENNTKDFRIGTILRALKALGAKVKLTVELEKKELIVA